jgi:hypothetical protein
MVATERVRVGVGIGDGRTHHPRLLNEGVCTCTTGGAEKCSCAYEVQPDAELPIVYNNIHSAMFWSRRLSA